MFAFIVTSPLLKKIDIITLPLTSSVPQSIKKLLRVSRIDRCRCFCPSFNDRTNSTKEIKFIKLGTIVIFRFQHYMMLRRNPMKDNRKVKCSYGPWKISVSCEYTVSFSASFSLQATMNHSGILQARHDWSFKRDIWMFHLLVIFVAMDVTPLQQKSLTNETSYFLFYSLAQ